MNPIHCHRRPGTVEVFRNEFDFDHCNRSARQYTTPRTPPQYPRGLRLGDFVARRIQMRGVAPGEDR